MSDAQARSLISKAMYDLTQAQAQLTPPPTPPPVEQPKPAGITFTPGLAGDRYALDETVVASLGAKVVRSEFAIGEAPTWVSTLDAFLKAHGAFLQPLVGFYGRIPNVGEAAAIPKALTGLSARNVEFGNETSYSYQWSDNSDPTVKARAEAYAHRAAEAASILTPLGYGLIVQADDGGSGKSLWVDAMFNAVPDLAKRVAGWSVHPYGTDGPSKVERMMKFLASHGETSLPIDVTEWGIASDNGRNLSDNYGWPTNLSYSEAAALLRSYVANIRKAAGPRLRTFCVYKDHDDQPTGASTGREGYFGAVQSNGAAKGAYTEAIKTLMAEK